MPRQKGFVKAPLVERFWAKVEKSDSGCWLWTGAVGGHGYGQLNVGGRAGGMKLAHRISYEMHVGAIPADLEIDHLCRNQRCVNPAHLEAVTHRENDLRGVGVSAQCATKTHCIRGHEYTTENTYRYGNTRQCRACRAIRRTAERMETVA